MDPYSILGISSSATPTQIRQAYTQRLKEVHPDYNPATDAEHDELAVILTAYRQLKHEWQVSKERRHVVADTTRRRQQDALLRANFTAKQAAAMGIDEQYHQDLAHFLRASRAADILYETRMHEVEAAWKEALNQL